MNLKKILIYTGIAILLAVVVIYLFLDAVETPEQYAAKIQQERKEKDDFMKFSPESPMASLKETFKPLKYYAPEMNFRIEASLEPVDERKIRTLTTSDGLEKRYTEYGFASFKLNGIDNKLLILEITDNGPYKGTLFLAFADLTSGRETYGAGRYLELKKIAGSSTITLDFNNAYNPYCAYANNFSCPFPPKENNLLIAINAGEKTWH